ncbi:CobW family GTP-binding protein [Neolewinella antarctica]|uniref:G3E family GTPase n=1 Tax=Neolewinella antarctica TaxID=442734 RepID=A0ABX0XC83_9BACT|nr:GTP-binding protein [Neolewinella antarctica]NJC26548.1 G3E family GTPase [Neolewinella antarctica]
MGKIPVYLITGFLGSGKTTFLNHFIQAVFPQRVMVIENEMGKINVDAGGLVIDGVEDVIPLSAGCLCCSLHDELLDALEIVSERREEFDLLVIGTTGVADPSSIVETFLADWRVGRVFELRSVICLADAGLLEDWLGETDEARRQLVSADLIFLYKADLISPSYAARLRAAIRGVNPTAVVRTGEFGRFDVSELLNGKHVTGEVLIERISLAREHEYAHGNIKPFTLTFEEPFDLDKLSHEMLRLVKLYYHQIYRIKGVVSIANHPSRVVLQSVRSTVTLTDGPNWEESEERRRSHFVFIGKDLRKDVMEKIVRRNLAAVLK